MYLIYAQHVCYPLTHPVCVSSVLSAAESSSKSMACSRHAAADDNSVTVCFTAFKIKPQVTFNLLLILLPLILPPVTAARQPDAPVGEQFVCLAGWGRHRCVA